MSHDRRMDMHIYSVNSVFLSLHLCLDQHMFGMYSDLGVFGF
jgi:hypothetical protein